MLSSVCRDLWLVASTHQGHHDSIALAGINPRPPAAAGVLAVTAGARAGAKLGLGRGGRWRRRRQVYAGARL